MWQAIVGLIIFAAGFVGGIAFWKHRVYLERLAEADAAKLQQAAQSAAGRIGGMIHK